MKAIFVTTFLLLVGMAAGAQSGYGEIGLSLGVTYSIGKHVRLVGHYLFVGYSGDEDESGARMQKGNFALDANVCRLQLGAQYLF